MSQSQQPSDQVPPPWPELPDLSELTSQLEQSLFAVRTSVEVFVDEETIDAQDDEDCPWQDPFPEWEGPILQIFDWKVTERAYANRVARLTSLESKRLTTLMDSIRSRGNYRKLVRAPSDWRTRLEMLNAQFPNFSEVVDYLRRAYALATLGDGVPRLAPVLLVGPPGIGKSLFADQFAREIGSCLVTVRMENAQTNSMLSGSAEYWGNTKSGEVLNTLLEKDFANPIFLLDEIDKTPEGDPNPLNSLYTLWEPTTAKVFADLSYPWLPVDASRVMWICTANDDSMLPEPLLDRLRCFDIPAPTPGQTRKMVRSIYAKLLADLPSTVSELRLTSKAIDLLIELSPRRIKQILEEALGQAVYEGRSSILARDIPTDDDKSPPKPPMGFLS
ncbi:MAG: AAA family ATPase [Limisphaerales bacterium]